MEAVIFIGIQGSGKSHFYKDRFFNSHVRISLDLLKTRAREEKLLSFCFQCGQPFVIDNTNPTLEDRARYIQAARQHGYRVMGYFFQPNVAESLKRNEMRSASAVVPKVAIFATLKRLQAPELAEGFDELFVVRSAPENTFSVEVFPGTAASTP